jgi:hypothetical protein
VGSVLQQCFKNVWKLLVFFSKKNSTGSGKYRAQIRDLLANYEAAKHFRHTLEARHFSIFTHHKSITYAFQQKGDKYSPRQFNHLDSIAQFATNSQQISGQDNVVANALFRLESVTAPPFYDALAAWQDSDG